MIMNIGFFTDTYLPQVNGVVTSVESFRLGLEALGHQVFIFAPKVRGYKDLAENKSKVFRFTSFRMNFMPSSGSNLANRLSLPFSLRAYLKLSDLKLDLVHSHTEFGMGQLACFVAATYRIPHIHTYHTIYPEYVHYFAKGRMISSRAAEKLSAMYCNVCTAIVAPSERVKDLLWKYGVRKPVEIIGTGIDYKEARSGNRQAGRKKFNLGKDFVCAYVGRLGKEKSVEQALRAFADLNFPNKRLLIVGDGPDKENLQELAQKLGMADRAIFTGYLTRQEVMDAYAAADALCFSSRTETQGLVILEAEAAGLPIVAMDDPAICEYVEDGKNGFLVNSVEEFTLALAKLASSEKLREQMGTASQKIAKNFTHISQSQKLLKVYEHVKL